MKKQHFIIVFIFALFTSACKNQAGTNFEFGDNNQMPSASTDASHEKALDEKTSTQKSNQPSEIKKDVTKIIKDGAISIEVNNIETSKIKVDEIVKKYKAYYESDVFSSYSNRSEYRLKIRMTPDSFEKLNEDLKNIDGRIVEKDIKTRDVTKEYLDIEIRVNNAMAMMKRYQDMLSKAQKVSDMIEIQNKINEIEFQIESHKGELKYMNDRINYSSLDLTIIEKHEYVNTSVSEKFSTKLINGIKTGWQIVLSLILGLVTIWPIILLAGTGFYFYKKRKRVLIK